MNALVLGVPLATQGVAMFFDELYFHRRRGLPRWERIGHPLDTLTVLLCFAVAIALPPTVTWLRVYAVLAVFSCLFVTKDEAVHAKHCERGELWLHALLFVLHPLVLASVALFWQRGWSSLVVGQAVVTLAFGVYQVVYWNLSWSPKCSPPETRAPAR